MAFGFGMGGFDGGAVPGSFHETRFRRRNDYRPLANAELNIYPHPDPRMPVSEYVKKAAAQAWLLPTYNWQQAGNPVSEPRILHADPWQPEVVQWPLGYSEGATGTTTYFAQCWEFDRDGKDKGAMERLFRPIAPEGFNLHLVVSGVTWRFAEKNCCSTSLVARIEGIVKYESHEKFMMERAGKLLADVEAWLKGA